MCMHNAAWHFLPQAYLKPLEALARGFFFSQRMQPLSPMRAERGKHRHVCAIACVYRWIVTGEVGNGQGRETAFEQPPIFEFFRHLAIKQCEGAHKVLRLRIFDVTRLFLDLRSAFQKALSANTEIHRAFNFSNINAFAAQWFLSIRVPSKTPGSRAPT